MYLQASEWTCDAQLCPKIDTASVKNGHLSGRHRAKARKKERRRGEGRSGRLNHPPGPVAGTLKPNAKDDKTQFELKTALL